MEREENEANVIRIKELEEQISLLNKDNDNFYDIGQF